MGGDTRLNNAWKYFCAKCVKVYWIEKDSKLTCDVCNEVLVDDLNMQDHHDRSTKIYLENRVL